MGAGSADAEEANFLGRPIRSRVASTDVPKGMAMGRRISENASHPGGRCLSNSRRCPECHRRCQVLGGKPNLPDSRGRDPIALPTRFHPSVGQRKRKARKAHGRLFGCGRKRGSALLGRHTREPSKRRKPPEDLHPGDANRGCAKRSRSTYHILQLKRFSVAVLAHWDCPEKRSMVRHQNGGADRDQTDDLVVANDALYQLSYCPMGKGSYLKSKGGKSTPILGDPLNAPGRCPNRRPCGQISSCRLPWGAG